MKLLDGRGLAYFWERLSSALEGKQDVLTGGAGQLVGFDADGRAAAVEARFVTEERMDEAISLAVTEAMEEAY